ncbi:MAG: TrkA family potassium uptake protein [Nitriliruptorales bacterium]|nr:TrkA family potassium uptake protein [Nitriliruptorales bacterium]
MHIIVGGCGRLGAEVAEQLSREPDNDVVVLDIDEFAFDRLGSAFNGETIVGNVTDRDVLEDAGIARAEGLIAVTRFDNANLMAVEIAEHLYGVPRAVARLFNPEREAVYRKLGVRYVSGTGVLAKLFLNEFREETFPRHLDFEHGDVSVVEMLISSNAHGMSVEDFELEGRLRVAAIQRGRRVFVPSADGRLERGDLVTAAIKKGTERRLEGLIERAHDHRHRS